MEGWGEAVRRGFWAGDLGEDDGAGEGLGRAGEESEIGGDGGRALRSGRKRRRGESEREAVVKQLKKDYLCRTIVMNRINHSNGERKDCEGAICGVLGPDEFEVVFYDGCSVTLSGDELEVVIVPEHDTDNEAAARINGAPLQLRRLANIARNQQILRGLDVEEGKAERLRGGALKRSNGGGAQWTDVEERTLQAEMAAAGIAAEDGAKLPSWDAFMPFAKTVSHLFGEHRSEKSIAHKVHGLAVVKGSTANLPFVAKSTGTAASTPPPRTPARATCAFPLSYPPSAALHPPSLT